MSRPTEPTYVRHIHGNKTYKVVWLDDSMAILEDTDHPYTSSHINIKREYLAEKFIGVDSPHTTVTYTKQEALAASAFLAASVCSNYLQHTNNNPRSSMGIRR